MQKNGEVNCQRVSGDGYSLFGGGTRSRLESVPRRPLAYAYARKHLLMYEAVFALTKLHLESFAKVAGYDLAAVFVEEINSPVSAFGRLLQAVIQDDVQYVIVPSMLHLALLGSPNHIKGYFEAATGARVITAA